MIAGRGHDARLKDELARVDAELGIGVEGERKVRAGRVNNPNEMHIRACRNGEGGGDEFAFGGRM